MTAPGSPLPPDVAPSDVPAAPQRRRGAEALPIGAGDHGLGIPHAACRRVADALADALGANPVGWAPLWVAGAALVAPVDGARFDASDPEDVALVVRLLASWPRRLLRLGAEVTEVDAERQRVRVARAPKRGDDAPVVWSQVGTRVELARWARRAAPSPEPCEVSPSLVAALVPDPERLARGLRIAARVRADEVAAGRPWPPVMEQTDGCRFESRTTHRPGMVLGGLTTLEGCVCAPGVPRVMAPAGGWRCPRCGVVTLVAELVGGPRLPECECLGDRPVCVHPVGMRGRP